MKPTAVQFSTSCASTIRGNVRVKFTSQPGNDRIVCSAEILRTKGVNSKFSPRIALRNSSTSEKRKVLSASLGTSSMLFMKYETQRGVDVRPAATPVRFPLRFSVT
ncbi:hypothetical protein [Bradyrhizobium diversitatis]|uniref:hypothetical protein n=1 Tax=Bradyrhizobium diversitatis TaxID=2755406 RepID=UPI00289D3278|nr:hypothetical protein [Bradyrhizobium diversitatis]